MTMTKNMTADMKLLTENAGYTDMAYWAAINLGWGMGKAAKYDRARENGATAQEALRIANGSYR